jgi:hypothetical protein
MSMYGGRQVLFRKALALPHWKYYTLNNGQITVYPDVPVTLRRDENRKTYMFDAPGLKITLKNQVPVNSKHVPYAYNRQQLKEYLGLIEHTAARQIQSLVRRRAFDKRIKGRFVTKANRNFATSVRPVLYGMQTGERLFPFSNKKFRGRAGHYIYLGGNRYKVPNENVPYTKNEQSLAKYRRWKLTGKPENKPVVSNPIIQMYNNKENDDPSLMPYLRTLMSKGKLNRNELIEREILPISLEQSSNFNKNLRKYLLNMYMLRKLPSENNAARTIQRKWRNVQRHREFLKRYYAPGGATARSLGQKYSGYFS